MCRTCILAGGPCFPKLTETKKYYCTRCMDFEKIDRDYLRGITEFTNTQSEERLVYQSPDPESFHDLASLGKVATESSQDWYKEHSYHLAWAVFNHLPCKFDDEQSS